VERAGRLRCHFRGANGRSHRIVPPGSGSREGIRGRSRRGPIRFRGIEPRCRIPTPGRAESKLPAQRRVARDRQERLVRIDPKPRVPGNRRARNLSRIRQQVGRSKRFRQALLFEACLAHGLSEALQGPSRVRCLREPQADRSAVGTSNEGRIEVDHHVEHGFSLQPVEMREDGMERRGHHKAGGASLVRREDLSIRGGIPFQEPSQRLGLDVDRGRARCPVQHGTHAPVRPQDCVRPVPAFDTLRPDPMDDRGLPLFECLCSKRVRFPPAHYVPGLISVEMEGEGEHPTSPFEGPRLGVEVWKQGISLLDLDQPRLIAGG